MFYQIIISGSQDIQVANSNNKETMFETAFTYRQQLLLLEGYIHKNSFFGSDLIN